MDDTRQRKRSSPVARLAICALVLCAPLAAGGCKFGKGTEQVDLFGFPTSQRHDTSDCASLCAAWRKGCQIVAHADDDGWAQTARAYYKAADANCRTMANAAERAGCVTSARSARDSDLQQCVADALAAAIKCKDKVGDCVDYCTTNS